MIEQQGENAPCAAFVFTKNDVFYYETDDDGDYILDEEKQLNESDTDDVLLAVGGCDWIYEQVNDIIDQEVRSVRNKQND